jgi:hypothetical protein
MPPEEVDPFVQKPPNFSFYTCSRRKLKSVDERNKKLSTADGKTEHMLTNTDS